MVLFVDIVLLVIAAVGLPVQSQTVDLTISKSSVAVGESVSITCEVSRLQNLDFAAIYKHVDGGEGDIKLSINSALQQFPGNERYKVVPTQLNPGFRFSLMINDVKAEDAGKFACELKLDKGALNQGQKVSLEVKVQPTIDLSFVNGSSSRSVSLYPNGLTFRAGQHANFRCVVSRGIPASLVTLRVGPHDITNIASQNQTQWHYSPSSDPKYRPAFEAIYYSVVATLHKLEMKTEFANQRLVCEAKNAAMSPISKDVIIRIEGVSPGSSTSHVAPGYLLSLFILSFVVWNQNQGII